MVGCFKGNGGQGNSGKSQKCYETIHLKAAEFVYQSRPCSKDQGHVLVISCTKEQAVIMYFESHCFGVTKML